MDHAGDIFCIGCGYNLRGANGTCAECGRAFDSNKGGNVARFRPPGWLTRAMLRPLGWPSIVLVFGSSAGLLWLGMYPAFYYVVNVMFITLWVIVLGFVYLLRCGIGSVCAARFGLASTATNGGRRRLHLGVVICVVILLLAAKAPLRLGFLTARSQLQEMVTAYRNGEAVPITNRRVGVYQVTAEFDPDDWHAARDGKPGGRPSDTIVFKILFADGGVGHFAYSPAGYSGFHTSGKGGWVWGDWYWFSDE